MSYVGNTPFTAAFLTDTFSGNGSTVAFTMSVAPANTSSILVAVTGVTQDPSTYSVSGTTLTFSAAPPTGTSNISVRYLGIPASGVTTTAYRTQTEFTATAGQTTFSVPSYTVGFIDVYRNGLLLGSPDFTATNGTTVVLTNAASAGDFVETVSFYVSSVLNALPNTGGTLSGQLTINSATGQIPFIAQVNGTEVFEIDASGNVGIGNVTPVGKLTVKTGTNENLNVLTGGGGDMRISALNDAASTTVQLSIQGSPLLFRGSGGVESMRINAGAPILCLAGGSTTATGTGIAFPATQSASTDANTLDDYEEGTYTPTVVVGSGTPTYSYQQGYYTKIGRQVFGGGIIGITNSNTLTGALKVTLPFTVAAASFGYTGGVASDGSGFTWPISQGGASFYSVNLQANPGVAHLTYTGVGSTAAEITYTSGGIAANWYFRFSFSIYV